MKAIYEKKNVEALHAKLSVSLLRYCDLIRIDKLYYDAGMAAKKQVKFHDFIYIINFFQKELAKHGFHLLEPLSRYL